MTSMLCNKQLGGVVGVHDENKIEELIIDGEDHIQTMYLDKSEPFLQRKKIRRPYSTPMPGYRGTMAETSGVDHDALIGHTLKLQDWLNEKTIKHIQSENPDMLPPNGWPHKKVAFKVPDNYLEKSDLETKGTRKLYEDMLNVEDSFVKEMEDLVRYKELLDLRKKELLHKQWTERVYQPIRRQVVTEANDPEFGEQFQRKRQLYKEYLDHNNRKGHVFLETFDPEEYYPLSLNPVRPGAITAHTKRLKDPLLAQERKRCGEDRVIIQCHVGSHLTDRDIERIRLPPLPLVPLGRHGTDATSWIEMPEGDIESPVRLASRRRMRGRNSQSQIHFAKSSLSPTDFVKLISDELKVQDSKIGVTADPLTSKAAILQIPSDQPENAEGDVLETVYGNEVHELDVPAASPPSEHHHRLRPLDRGVAQVPLLFETSPVAKIQNVAVQTSC